MNVRTVTTYLIDMTQDEKRDTMNALNKLIEIESGLSSSISSSDAKIGSQLGEQLSVLKPLFIALRGKDLK